MSNRKTLTASRLKEVAVYDLATGVFRSAINRGPIKIGDLLGGVNKSGYLQVQIDAVIYYGHRLAWLYVHGEFPVESIDHIDGNKLNNSIANLRQAFRGINQQNQRRPRIDNKAGHLGVSRHPGGKWVARIKTSETYKHLGLYATPELASQAYLAAKRTYHEGNTL